MPNVLRLKTEWQGIPVNTTIGRFTSNPPVVTPPDPVDPVDPELPVEPETPADPGIPGASTDPAKIARSLEFGIPAGYPRFETVGVPDGTVLTVRERDYNITTDTVLDSLEIRGVVKANNANVTLRRCKIVDPASYKVTTVGTGTVLMEDCEVDGANGGGAVGIGHNNITMRRCFVHHCVDGIRPTNNCVIEDSLVVDSVDNEAANHVDCLQMTGGLNIVIRRNTFLSWRATGAWGNAAIGIGCETNRLKDVLIEGNYMSGGNTPMFVKNPTRWYGTVGSTATTGTVVQGAEGVRYDMINVVVRNNEFRGDQRSRTTAGAPATYADITARESMRSTTAAVSPDGANNIVFVGNFSTPPANRNRTATSKYPEGVWRDGLLRVLFQNDIGSGSSSVNLAPDAIGYQVDPTPSTPSTPTLVTKSLSVASTGVGQYRATLVVTANVAQTVAELTVAVRAATNPVDNGDLDPTHRTNLSLPAGDTTLTFDGTLDEGTWTAHLAYRRTTTWARDETIKPSFTTTAAVSGVAATFNTSTRVATVTWAKPRAGTVTITRFDNGSTAAAATTTGVSASSGTWASAAIPSSTTSAVYRVTHATNGTTGQVTLDTPTSGSSTGTNPLGLRAMVAGASVTGAANGNFNTFAQRTTAGTRPTVLFATWGENAPWTGSNAGKAWALINGSSGEYGAGKLSTLGRIDLDVAPQFGHGGSWSAASTSTAMRTWLVNYFTELKNALWFDTTQRMYFRPCHEMNGNWYTNWRVTSDADAEAFKKWWREILYPAWSQVFGSDPRALLEWCPNRDSSYVYTGGTNKLYPGAAYVDVHGVDYYDFGFKGTSLAISEAAWASEINSTQNGGIRGLQTHLDFAAANGKALVIPEMGQQFNDRPDFVTRFTNFCFTNRYTGTGSPSGKVIGFAWHNLRGSSPDPNAGSDFFIQEGGNLYSRSYTTSTGTESLRPNASAVFRGVLQDSRLRTI